MNIEEPKFKDFLPSALLEKLLDIEQRQITFDEATQKIVKEEYFYSTNGAVLFTDNTWIWTLTSERFNINFQSHIEDACQIGFITNQDNAEWLTARNSFCMELPIFHQQRAKYEAEARAVALLQNSTDYIILKSDEVPLVRFGEIAKTTFTDEDEDLCEEIEPQVYEGIQFEAYVGNNHIATTIVSFQSPIGYCISVQYYPFCGGTLDFGGAEFSWQEEAVEVAKKEIIEHWSICWKHFFKELT